MSSANIPPAHGPWRLVTVNTAPERAKKLIGRMIEGLKAQYTIVHAANVEDIKDVKSVVEKIKPDLLFCASMWTPDQSQQIQAIAHEIVPGIKTMALPQGLQVQRGPDAVVDYLIEKVPGLIESNSTKQMASFEESVAGFRRHLPNLSSPRFEAAANQNPYEYVDAFRKNQHPPWIYNLTKAWEKLLEEPYQGITTDGTVVSDLFIAQDEKVPIDQIVGETKKFLKQLTPEQLNKACYPLNAKEWRAWSNPEFLLRPLGLRLEEVSDAISGSILSILEATFSQEGYQKAVSAMKINHFLGEVCNIPKIMNKGSYNFLLFGEPSTDKPWGWSFYGHHLCLSVFLRGPQIVISPTFTGAEPNVIDKGEWAGTEILDVEGNLGLSLMQSLSDDLKSKAQAFKQMRDPGMLQSGDLIKDRWNQDDQRHLCGAFRDNRIVPFEGVLVSDFTAEQQQLILDITKNFVLYLPETARKMRLEQVATHFKSTYFSWIGGWGKDDPFYYRIQSPVIIMEFDHHSGVFLTNSEPAKFHVHTILRTPNAGDYGCALRKPEEVVQ